MTGQSSAPQRPSVARTIAQVARQLPLEHVRALASAAAAGTLPALERSVGVAGVRDSCQQVGALVKAGADPNSIALALLAAGEAAAGVRAEQGVQLVWTGPGSSQTASRLTTVVLPDIIGQAREHLLLVSYAAYPTEPLRESLERAVERGVSITLLLECPDDNPAFHGPADPFPGLAARRLAWPAPRRPVGASLHAKLLVIDRRTALIGSANLTGRAEVTNLECGVLLRGGPRPGQLRDHVEDLLRLGVLEQVQGWRS